MYYNYNVIRVIQLCGVKECEPKDLKKGGVNMASNPSTYRFNEEDVKKFKEFCVENGWNQADGFAAVLELAELGRFKEGNAERATEINNFNSLIQSLVKTYTYSLEYSSNTETRVRQDFSRQLDSQIDTIADLRKQVEDLKNEKKEALEEARLIKKEATDKVNENNNYISVLNEKVSSLTDELDKTKTNFENIQEMLNVFKKQAADNEENAKKYFESLKEINDLNEYSRELEKQNSEMIKDHAFAMKQFELDKERELSLVKHECDAKVNELNQLLKENELNFEREKQEVKEKATKELTEIHEFEVNEFKVTIRELNEELKELRSIVYKKEVHHENY